MLHLSFHWWLLRMSCFCCCVVGVRYIEVDMQWCLVGWRTRQLHVQKHVDNVSWTHTLLHTYITIALLFVLTISLGVAQARPNQANCLPEMKKYVSHFFNCSTLKLVKLDVDHMERLSIFSSSILQYFVYVVAYSPLSTLDDIILQRTYSYECAAVWCANLW